MPKDIRYSNRDFDSIKTDLLNVIKQTFPDFGNFSGNSSSMMLVELQSYLGDVHHYMIDAYYREGFLDSAVEKSNLINLGKLLNYKYKGKTRSIVDLDLFITVPYINQDGIRVPDTRYFLTIEKGSVFKSNTTPVQYFEIIEDANFNDYDSIEISRREDDNDADTAVLQYALKKTVKAINGRRKTETITVGDYVPFYKVSLSETNVLDIVSLTDGSNNPYYEVDYLAQDAIFKLTTNSATGDELKKIPYIIDLQKVSRRFIRNIDENNITTLTFGSGSESFNDDTLVPSPYPLVLSSTSYAGNVIDPNNFLSTSTLGISPANTTLNITYRYGGGAASNVPAMSIIDKEEISYHFPTSDLLPDKQAVYQSIASLNMKPAQGGIDELTTEEIRNYASASFASQKRAVSITDYIALVYTMPSSFGSVYRLYAEASTGSDNSINLYALALNDQNQLVAPYDSLSNNIKTYLEPYKMINDTVYLQAGNVINIGINFGVVIADSKNKSEVLFECINLLKEEFNISKMDFNRPIMTSKVYDLLHDVNGVISVGKVTFVNLVGTKDNRVYSNYEWNIPSNTIDGILYSAPEAIFEVKYPDIDIRGTIL